MKITSFAASAAYRSLFVSFVLIVAAFCGAGCKGLPTYGSSDPNRPNYMKWQGVNRVTIVNKTRHFVRIFTTAHEPVEVVAEGSTVTIYVNMDYNEHYGEYAFVLRAFSPSDQTKQVGYEIIKTIGISNADNGYGYVTPRINVITIRPGDFADSY